ncbi:Hypothetical protein NTJ_10857 [Nesidiocoris tenuis]|uniref:Odorant receptor n=1 Tax=Nesidiocoris tenuis TaxID=355587 RepID=A0ABN7B337_9HEMI|nr:Hypothetical protein NTJ_10857 [Nesidiocoris tenuis]
MEGQKELYDERVANYIESVRLWGFWFPDDELTWGKIIFVAVKLTFLSVICGSCFYGLSCYDSFGFAEGHFPFGPSLLVSVILQAIFVVKRNVHKELILSIEVILKEYNEPWMLESRKTPMDAYCRLFRYTFMVLNVANVFFYSTPSILIDAVGYGLLGWFSKPIVVPNSLSAYLEGTNLTSGVWFYALLPISALGTYVAVVVLVMSPQCFGNILLFLLSELTIIKKKIKILQTVEDPLKQSQMIRDIVKHQSSGIR